MKVSAETEKSDVFGAGGERRRMSRTLSSVDVSGGQKGTLLFFPENKKLRPLNN